MNDSQRNSRKSSQTNSKTIPGAKESRHSRNDLLTNSKNVPLDNGAMEHEDKSLGLSNPSNKHSSKGSQMLQGSKDPLRNSSKLSEFQRGYNMDHNIDVGSDIYPKKRGTYL